MLALTNVAQIPETRLSDPPTNQHAVAAAPDRFGGLRRRGDEMDAQETHGPPGSSEHDPDAITVEEAWKGEKVLRVHSTDSRIPLAPSYGPEDLKAADENAPGEKPGEYPFTRGLTPDGYRQKVWHFDLYAGFGNVEDARERYKQLLEGGASGVNIALDLPTQLGLDSDHGDALGEVGRVGVAIDAFDDVRDLFDEIPLAEAGVVFTVGNCIGPMAAAWFVLLAEHQRVDPNDFVLHLQNDPLKEFTGRGTFIFPIEPSIRLSCDVIEYAVRNRLDNWKPIGICGSQYRWSGGDAVQEIAFGIASARIYIDELLRRGLDIDEFGPLLELHLASDMDLLEEVAKFRAARRVWARMMKEDYGAKLPESQQLRVSLYTAGYRLTAQEPLNNSVRITLMALAAALGGVQHIGTLSIDEALATPSQEASRLAVATQNILAYETSIGSVADPLGGSWLVEHLTDELEGRIKSSMDDVEQIGGVIAALKSGYLRGRIDDSAYAYQKEIEEGTRTVVGVNRFKQQSNGSSSIKPFKIKGKSAERQIERLLRCRQGRSQADVDEALELMVAAAEGTDNMVEPLINAFRQGATIGEVCDGLRGVFGSWRDEGVAF